MSLNGSVIFVDDEKHVRVAAKQTLELAGHRVLDFASAESALKHVAQDWPGMIVSDVKMPGTDGLEFLKQCLEIDPDVPVVLVTGHGDISMAVQAMRDGAYDFLEKPWRPEAMLDVVKRALEKRYLVLENRSLRLELEKQKGPDALIIGRTPVMEQARRAITGIADTDATVLIRGETGTGKELVAHCLHQQSKRQRNRFVAINCGALPESIIESELFGHEAGSFTGANTRRIGKFEHADGGTLFLDEIESMPITLQVKLLRVLQEHVLERLGSNESIPIDIRVVATTKTDLQRLVAEERFREDLYYRLNVLEIRVSPLRERREDIPLLFQHFVLRASSRYQRTPPLVTKEILSDLMSQSWPGNVRELQNAAERFVLSSLTGVPDLWAPSGSTAVSEGLSLPEQVAAFEKSIIAQELANQRGRISETHAELGVPRKTLYDKMRKYGLHRSDFAKQEES